MVFEANITHNLADMAIKAGLYKALWRPDENNFVLAEDIIHILEKGLAKLKAKPAYYKKFNPKNGWGDYDNLVSFVEKYMNACEENPKLLIQISR